MDTRMPRRSLAILLMTTATVSAQHVDVLVWDEGGKVGVGLYDYDNLIATETRVHLARFDSLYSVNNPGFTAFAGPDAVPGNAELRWDFLPMTVDDGSHAGYESTLLYWDGEGAVPEFGPTPTDAYEFSLFGEGGPATADGGDQIVPGGVIDTTSPSGAIHEHRYYFLDDNGDGSNATLPAAGIYLVGLQLEIGELAPSDPVFMVWATPELSVLPAIRPAAIWVNERVDTLFAEPLEGDFNADGLVDAADYTVWRDGLGTTYESSDYDVWAANYGASVSSGSSAEAPEPSGCLLMAVAAVGGACFRSPIPSFGA
ncbi:hypothetical protein MalM25_14140 [Planctomycetes bacterium MalM25]|nr:hypothetical protein MalM25_14140 [Planctomycetes bacterium MalM25]